MAPRPGTTLSSALLKSKPFMTALHKPWHGRPARLPVSAASLQCFRAAAAVMLDRAPVPQ
jgi:hypothetical protein